MCVSIRGFTAMCEPLEPERVAAVLENYYAEAAEAVELTEGLVVECAGDRVIAMWDEVEEREHHAALAVRAGLQMVSRGSAMNQRLHDQNLPPIRYGVGIDSGDAAVGEMGRSGARHFTVVGDAVNRAELLSEVAGGGEMLIGDSAHSIVEGEITVQEVGEVKLGARKAQVKVFVVSSSTLHAGDE
jgi:adenylate cyclase